LLQWLKLEDVVIIHTSSLADLCHYTDRSWNCSRNSWMHHCSCRLWT